MVVQKKNLLSLFCLRHSSYVSRRSCDVTWMLLQRSLRLEIKFCKYFCTRSHREMMQAYYQHNHTRRRASLHPYMVKNKYIDDW